MSRDGVVRSSLPWELLRGSSVSDFGCGEGVSSSVNLGQLRFRFTPQARSSTDSGHAELLVSCAFSLSP